MSLLLTNIDESVDSTDQSFGNLALYLISVQVTNLDSEDAWLLFYDGASIAAGTLRAKIFVPKGDGTARGAVYIEFATPGILFNQGCHYKAVKTSDGVTTPDTALEMFNTYQEISG